MQRIDSSTAVSSLPTQAALGTPGYFAAGNPSSGIPYTVTTNDWANAIQEEIAAVILSAGLTLSKTNNAQLLQALGILFHVTLTADLVLHVGGAGANDANDGSSGSPFATIQHAVDHIMGLNLNGFGVTINVANGTYAGVSLVGQPMGFDYIKIIGNTSSPSACIIDAGSGACVSALFGGQLTISGFQLTAATGGTGIVAAAAATIYFDHIRFDTCSFAHMYAYGAGIITADGNPYTVLGGSNQHIFTSQAGAVDVSGCTITFSGSPSFSQYVAYAITAGVIYFWDVAQSGSVSGIDHLATTGGSIITHGAPSLLTGTSSGSSATGYYT